MPVLLTSSLWNILKVHQLRRSPPLYLLGPFMRNQQKTFLMRRFSRIDNLSITLYLSISNFFLPSHFLESVWNKYYIVLYYSGMLYNFYKTKNRYYIYKLDLKLMIEYSCFLSPLLLFMWSWFEDEGKWICINKNIMTPPYIGVSMCLPFSLFPNHHQETLTWLLGFTPSHLSLSNLQAT